MTSGTFKVVPVNSITVKRDERQRKKLEGIEELAASIAANGLINPIVITRDHVLVAGERRLTAHRHLGFDNITVQYAEDLDEVELHLIELEENVRRQDLHWRDHVEAVAKYHEIRLQQNPAWSQDQTASELNIDRTTLSKQLLVKQGLDEKLHEVIEAPKFSQALSFIQRKRERQQASVLRDLRQQSQPEAEPAKILTPEGEVIVPPAESSGRFAELINTNFRGWAKELQIEPYNFIHCDFPYGVNAGDTKGQSGAGVYGTYDDKPEVFFELLDTLIEFQDNFISPSAHMMFWFSMDFYEVIRVKLQGAGWRVDPFPLIWYKSDNTGIIPDAMRGPRRGYETAFHCTRGDRKVVKPINSVAAAGVTKNFHTSEKAVAMLEHFFRMYVDETSRVLDPTCGSGNAIKVAESMGAMWATGIERDFNFYTGAMENLGL